MAKYIQVNARYDKMMENGATKKVTEPYLADALSCTEAETRVIEELSYLSGGVNITSVATTKISEIFFDETGDYFYRVKVNFITLDEKTAVERRTASFILVQANTLDEALTKFHNGMKGTIADYEIESISQTKIVEVYKFKPASDGEVS